MKLKKWIIVLLIAIVAIILISLFKKGSGVGTTKVTVEKASIRTIIETVSASGKIQPEKEVVISSDVSGEIIEMPLKEGQVVAQRDLLLKINPDLVASAVNRAEAALNTSKANLMGSRARLAQAESQFENAKSSYNRNQSLYKSKVISDAEYDQAKANYLVAQSEVASAKESVEASKYNVKSAEATLSEAKENLGRTSIYSPMGGTITKVNKEQGERVVGTAQMAGTEILTVADLSVMEVAVEVNENDIVRVAIGDTADIEVDAYLDEKFKGIVTEIANSADVSGKSAEQVTNFDVKIRMIQESYKHLIKDTLKQSSPFRPGMSATVDIRTKTANQVISVPIQAVTSRAVKRDTNKVDFDSTTSKSKEFTEEKQEECVFVVNDKKAKQVSVKTGIQNTAHIEIIVGLEKGDEVISGPYSAVSKTLKDGDEVEIVNRTQLFTPKKD